MTPRRLKLAAEAFAKIADLVPMQLKMDQPADWTDEEWWELCEEFGSYVGELDMSPLAVVLSCELLDHVKGE